MYVPCHVCCKHFGAFFQLFAPIGCKAPHAQLLCQYIARGGLIWGFPASLCQSPEVNGPYAVQGLPVIEQNQHRLGDVAAQELPGPLLSQGGSSVLDRALGGEGANN